MLGHGWRVGSAVIGNRYPEFLEKPQVDPFIAGTQHLKQLELFCRVQLVRGGIARIRQNEVCLRYFPQARVGWRALLQKIHTKARRQLRIDHVNNFGRDQSAGVKKNDAVLFRHVTLLWVGWVL